MPALRLRVRIYLPVRSVLVWLLAGLCLSMPPAGALARHTLPASAGADTHGMRRYYATLSLVPGNQVWSACADGYHMASMWELYDLSNLIYNPELGAKNNDSGAGPPSVTPFFNASLAVKGWVRTGYVMNGSSTVGRANCDGWTSPFDYDYGTVAMLPSDWVNGEKEVGVWHVEVQSCDGALTRVWCIEDNATQVVFLPVVLK
jgi:hypothetical protein